MRLAQLNIFRLLESDYFKGVLQLFSGVALAQIIYIASSPILSRIFNADAFGEYTLFINISSFISIILTGQYELSILNPRKESTAHRIIEGTFLLMISITALLEILALFFYFFAFNTIFFFKSKWLILLIPFGSLAASSVGILGLWGIRVRQFSVISRNKIVENITNVLCSCSLGLLGFSPGMILGRMIGQGISFILYAKKYKKAREGYKSSIYLIKRTLARYIYFPLLSGPSSLINSFAYMVPSLLMTKYWGPVIFGSFGFASSVLSIPLTLVTKTLGDAFRERAARDYRNSGSCRSVFVKTFFILLAFAIPLFIAIFFLAPIYFPIIFGLGWNDAGKYSSLMSVMFFFQFISNPLASVIIIAEKQRVGLILQSMLCIGVVASLVYSHIQGNFSMALNLYIATYSLFYISILIFSYSFSESLNTRI